MRILGLMFAVISVSAFAEAPTLDAKPFCFVSSNAISVMARLTTKWVDPKIGAASNTKVYSITCTKLESGWLCLGAYVSAFPREQKDGSLLIDSPSDLGGMGGIDVKSSSAGIAVLQWGAHIFVVDSNAGTITKSADRSPGVVERGSANCR